MYWLEVIFVMVLLNRLSSVQKEVYETEDNSTMLEFIKSTIETTVTPICPHKALDVDIFGCRNTDNLTLNIKWHKSGEISQIENIENGTRNCYKFNKIDDFFVTTFNESQSDEGFCEEYALLSESGTPIYYIDGNSLSKVQRECPSEEELCVIDKSIATCPLTNFRITPIYNKNDIHNYINLQISWDKIQKDVTVSVRILQRIEKEYKRDCLPEMHEFSLPLLYNNTIVKPNMVTKQEVQPGCTYDIFMFSEWGQTEKINCTYTYRVPDCVETRCDCDKFKPQPKIVNVEHISENKFLVRWDPGDTTIDNSSQRIKEVQFGYDFSNKPFDIYREIPDIVKSNLDGHSSEIKMKLFDGENYTLTGTFTNNFSCSAEDKFHFKAPTRSNYNVLIIIFFAFVLVLIIVVIIYNKVPKYINKVLDVFRPNRRSSQQHELSRLQAGQVPMNTNIQYTPIEFLDGSLDEYEFPRNKIILKEIIGSGAFGQVYSAKAIEIGGIDGYKMVAVKTLGEGEHISRDATNDFIAEIEIFKKIGKHPNVVTLLGCCTITPPYMMIMEFVPCGDLKNYLLELREQWLKKKGAEKRQIFFPDTSDGAYIQAPEPTTPVSITSSRLPSTSETVCTTLDDIPMTPLLSQYTLDKVLDHTELQNFALQIARGMAHLESISVTHRDLAARNILINEYKTLKISDFGLSRSGPYINHKTKKLPLRWMAIEAIVNQKYDSKSDVWSFGVVLWEIGTLGAFPYESVLDSFLQQFLLMGRRLDRPEICTDELYSLMKQCWAADPEKRPTFQELVEALDVKKRKIYVNFNQLNPTYIFPPSDIDRCMEVPVQIVDIDI